MRTAQTEMPINAPAYSAAAGRSPFAMLVSFICVGV